jgi:hypothetical protein
LQAFEVDPRPVLDFEGVERVQISKDVPINRDISRVRPQLYTADVDVR